MLRYQIIFFLIYIITPLTSSEPTTITMIVEYKGSTALEIEQQVAIPVNHHCSNLKDLIVCSSLSQNDFAVINLVFAADMPLDQRRIQVLKHMQKALFLPVEAQVSLTPIVSKTLIYKIKSNLDFNHLYGYANELREKTLSIPGVSCAAILGIATPFIQVKVYENSLMRYGLSLQQIHNVLTSSLQNISSLKLQDGNKFIISQNTMSLSDLEKTIVSAGHIPIYLKDIATISFGVHKEQPKYKDILLVLGVSKNHSQVAAKLLSLNKKNFNRITMQPFTKSISLKELDKKISSTPQGYICGNVHFIYSLPDIYQEIHRSLVVKIKGPGLEQLHELSLSLEQKLQKIPEIAKTAVLEGKFRSELQIILNRKRMAPFGITSEEIYEWIKFNTGNKTLGQITLEGKKLDVALTAQNSDGSVLENLESGQIMTQSGAQVPISEIVQVIMTLAPQKIYRENGKRTIRIFCYPRPGANKLVNYLNRQKLHKEILQLVGGLSLPLGYTVEIH